MFGVAALLTALLIAPLLAAIVALWFAIGIAILRILPGSRPTLVLRDAP